MGLNIKKPTTEAAIRELAAETGESLTDAVENAVREKLARMPRKSVARAREELAEALRPFREEVMRNRKKRGETRTTQEILDDYYDEDGLPI